MTRGKLVLVTGEDTSCLVSTEFNGDMYPDGYGAVAYSGLSKVKTIGDFHELIKKFVKVYGYDEKDEQIEQYKLAGTLGDYFSFWFSDYLYIKNVCGRDIVVTDKKGEELELPNDTVVVLDFGVKVPDADLQLTMSRARDEWFEEFDIERTNGIVLKVSEEFKEWYDNEAEDSESVFIGGEKERIKYFHAIVGVSTDGRVIYDYKKLVSCFIAEGLTEEEAREHISYNVEGSLRGLGEHAPILMRSFSD